MGSSAERSSTLEGEQRFPPAVGDLLNQYQLDEVLGQGLVGILYRASDLRLGRRVALRVIRPELRADEPAWQRLLHEVQAVSRLCHPAFRTIYDLDEDNGRCYIAMEYVEGRRLSDVVGGTGLPKQKVLHYGAQLASALTHAHNHGVIYRGLRTSNIIVQPDGTIKFLDFVLALPLRANAQGQKGAMSVSQLDAGKCRDDLAYAAPELLRGEPASVQSDIWSLGVVLFEMTTGYLPFSGRPDFERGEATMTSAPRSFPQDTDSGVSAIIYRCLQKACSQRYATVQDLTRDIQRTFNGSLGLPAEALSRYASAGAHCRRGSICFTESLPLGPTRYTMNLKDCVPDPVVYAP